MDILEYYRNEKIQKAILAGAGRKEVVGSFEGKGYAKRPDILRYISDITELAKQGVTSFHASEELWSNPLQLEPTLKRQELDKLRLGWDLVLDIDCPVLAYSTIAAELLVKALRYMGLGSVSCKFSGNHGYHIAVPFEAFPVEFAGKETRLLFPEAPRKIALLLKSMMKDLLAAKLLELEDISVIARKVGKKTAELMPKGEFDPFTVLEVDTILISSRHLYRMPYSINEKSGLVSLPIDPDKVLEFKPEQAKMENVSVNKHVFLGRSKVVSGEATKLLVQAYDFSAKIEDEIKINREFDYEDIKEAVPEELFPPCIRLMLKGMKDGKKRSEFILVNFLRSVGWQYEQIEELLRKWNERNPEQLREVYLIGQLRYHKTQAKKVLPPNCDNQMYYKDLGVCCPDNLCNKISNPVNYARRRVFAIQKKTVGRKQLPKDPELVKIRKERLKQRREQMKNSSGEVTVSSEEI